MGRKLSGKFNNLRIAFREPQSAETVAEILGVLQEEFKKLI